MMRSLSLAFCTLLLSFFSIGRLSAQCVYTFSGYVTTLNNPAVSGQTVYLDFDSLSGPLNGMHFGTFSNANGYYEFNITGSCDSNNVLGHLYTVACDDTLNYYASADYDQPVSQSFLICDSVNCSGLINLSYINQGISVTAAVPGADGFLWTFGDGTETYSANASHVYADSGTYTVCLHAPVSAQCSFDSCFTVNVALAGTADSCHVDGQVSNYNGGIEFGWLGGNSLGVSPVSVLWDMGNGYVTNNYPNGGVYTYPALGTYTACVTVTWASGCVATDCQSITIGPALATFCGDVFYQLPGDSTHHYVECGTVYLLSVDTGGVTVIDSLSLGWGSSSFCFPGHLLGGNYTVLAVPCDSLASALDLMPTYLGNELFWQNATVTGSTNLGMITLINGQEVQGPGLIGGTILWGDDKAPGDPVIGARVLLLDEQGSPISFTTTDAEGYYSFGNLPYGTYRIYPEAAGYITYSVLVTISEETPSVEATNFSLGFGIFMGVEEQPVAFRGLYPNPAVDMATLSLLSKESGNGSVRITDLTGKTVAQIPVSISKGQQNISLDVQSLTAGVYTVTLTLRGQQLHAKLIKR